MSDNEVIALSQDGLVILDSATTANFVYTNKIQTCCIYIFHFNHEIAVLHDTGQLSIDSIVSAIQDCGNIERISFALNPIYMTPAITGDYVIRRTRLAQALGFRRNIRRIDLPGEELVVGKDRRIYSQTSEINRFRNSISVSPRSNDRENINVSANFFTPSNS